MDRSRISKPEHFPAMCAGRVVPLGVLLHSARRIRREPGTDAPSGRRIHEASVFRSSTDASVSCQKRLQSQSQAGKTAAQKHGIGSYLCKTAALKTGARTSDLSLSFTQPADRTPQSSMGHRYNIYPVATGLCVSDSDHGLVQPLRAFLGIVGQPGRKLLYYGAAMGIKNSKAGDLQHGPGIAVHQRHIHESSSGSSDPNKHGWPRPSSGQHLRRTPVENSEIRRGLSKGLQLRQRSIRRSSDLFSVLQSRTRPSVPGRSDSGICLFQQEDPNIFWRQTGHDYDQGPLNAPICGEKPTFEKHCQSPKGYSGLWKLTREWKSAKSADSHSRLEKPSAFPQFPQALRAFLSLSYQ
jgi:hypothetical protein